MGARGSGAVITACRVRSTPMWSGVPDEGENRATPRVGIRAVARVAGVSPTTVSHALSGTRPVRPETRDRVLRAAAELGYTPDRVAQGMRRGRTGVVGFASDRIATTPFAGRIIQGAQEVARDHDVLLMVVDSEGDAELEARQFRALAAQRVDGVLIARMFHQVVARPGIADDVPIALADAAPEPGWRVPAVVPDERGIAWTAVRRLLAAGHRRIAHVSTVDDSQARAGREAGFADALAEAGAGVTRGAVARATSDAAGGRTAGEALLDRPPHERPTAIFCFNDQMAMGVFQAAAALGLDVPNDLSVLGVDDLELISAGIVPGLTTVALPHREMGRWGMRSLLATLDDADAAEPAIVRLACELVERGSVASPAA